MKRGRKENRAPISRSATKENTMLITRTVSKTVKGPDGKDFKRTANISFEAPDKIDNIEDLVASFGSVEKLYQAAFFGVISRAKYNANNELLKGDKASKALKKMVAGLKAVMTSLTDEQATNMVLSNSAMADAFKAEPMTAEISISVNPATLEIPSLNDDEPEETPADEKDETPAV
jgi:hypothetical protein